jgi:hypothetical protein
MMLKVRNLSLAKIKFEAFPGKYGRKMKFRVQL